MRKRLFPDRERFRIVTASPIADRRTFCQYCEKGENGLYPVVPTGGGSCFSGKKGPIKSHIRTMESHPLTGGFLAWLLARSPVILPIPGTSKGPHLEENVAAAELQVDASKMQELDRLGLPS